MVNGEQYPSPDPSVLLPLEGTGVELEWDSLYSLQAPWSHADTMPTSPPVVEIHCCGHPET